MTERSAPEPIADPVLSGTALWLLGGLLALSNFLAIMDLSVANVSVNVIAGSLGASVSQGTWVITSYAVAEAIMVPLTGWLAGRFGQVRMFILANALFGIGSALCGFAPTLVSLAFLRVLQGMAGGLLMPLSQTLIFRIFPPRLRGAGMGLWAIATLCGPIAGPTVGGLLCDNFGWASIFWVNVPVAAFAVWRMSVGLKGYRETPSTPRLDIVGLVLLAIWIGALQLVLDLGKDRDWFTSPLICGLAVAAVVGFLAFILWELTERDPVVALKVFRHPGFAFSMLNICIGFSAMYAANLLTPLWLQTEMGYTATQAGYVTSMLGVLAVFAAPLAAWMSGRMDPRGVVCLGVAGMGLMTVMRGLATTDQTFWQTSIWVLLSGGFMTLYFMPLNTLALSSVEPDETASAAGILNFFRTMSGAVSVSLFTAAWDTAAVRQQAELVATLPDSTATLATLSEAGLGTDGALAALSHLVHSQAVMIATNQMMLVCAGLYAVAGAAIWLAPKPAHVIDPLAPTH